MAKIRQVLRWMAVVTTSATLPLAAHGAVTNVTGQVVLAEDADWRGFGLVSMAEGASIDLAGHALKVDGVAQAAAQLVNVLFTRARSGYYGVTAQDDGVYAISGGIMVIVR